MSGGMSANWRAPTVGIMGNGGMRNPSDHASKPMQEIIKTVIEERIVEKFVDRPVYVVSEEMYKTLVEIAQRLDGMEKRQLEVERTQEKYLRLLEDRLNRSEEKFDELVARMNAEHENNQRFHDIHQKLLETHAKHPKTLWGWIKELWAD